MLRRKVQSSYFRDAYLYAIWSEAGRPAEVEDPWFYGYSTTPRWMLTISAKVGLRSVPDGIAVQLQHDSATTSSFANLVTSLNLVATDDGWLLKIPQSEVVEMHVDSSDRVQLGADLLRRLVTEGF